MFPIFDRKEYGEDIPAVVVREIKRILTNPLYLFGTIILPLLSFFIFWAIFFRGVPQELPVAVCDSDHTELSRKVIRMLDASSTIKIAFSVNDLETAQRYIREGKVYAIVIFQKGLERDAYTGKAPLVVSYYNNEFLLPGSLISRDIRNVVSSVSAQINLPFIQGKGGSAVTGPSGSDPIKVDVHQLFNPYLNYTYYLVSAFLPTMMQIFILVMTIYALGIEFKEGTAREWYTTGGGHVWKALLGKLLPYTVIFVVLSIFMNIFLFRFLEVPFKGSLFWIVLADVLFVSACQAVGMLIITLTANLRFSLSTAAFLASTAFIFVGVTFPAEGMPQLAKAWAEILPLTHYLKIFTNQAVRGGPAIYDILPLTVLGCFALFLPVFPVIRMRVLMTNEKYWGRI